MVYCRLSHLADVFCMTGKVLSNEWLGHLERRVTAAGGTERDAHCIYEEFHAIKAAHKRRAKRRVNRGAGGGGEDGVEVKNEVAARVRAAARKKFASQLKECENTVFCLESSISAPYDASIASHGTGIDSEL
jgi:hypothetical protein